MKSEIRNGKLFLEGKEIQIGEFIFLAEIGRGANAVTFLVKNNLPERKEVIKVWYEENKYGRLKIEKFMAEIQKNATLHVRNTPVIYEAKEQDNLHWCRMEYIEGNTLKERLGEKPEFYTRYWWTESILNILEEVYQKGIWHGDLHSKNIIIEKTSEQPYIIDFGTSILSGIEKSHLRDATMLYNLVREILPEMKDLVFITDELCKEPSKIICEVLQFAIKILSGIIRYKKNELDEYGIKGELIIPIYAIQSICQENKTKFKVEQQLVDKYFDFLKLDRKEYDYILKAGSR